MVSRNEIYGFSSSLLFLTEVPLYFLFFRLKGDTRIASCSKNYLQRDLHHGIRLKSTSDLYVVCFE